jgi:hypothetical protein
VSGLCRPFTGVKPLGPTTRYWVNNHTTTNEIWHRSYHLHQYANKDTDATLAPVLGNQCYCNNTSHLACATVATILQNWRDKGSKSCLGTGYSDNFLLSLQANLFMFVVHCTTPSVTQTIQCRMFGLSWTMNWNACGRNRAWPNLSHYPGIVLEGQGKTTKSSARIVHVPVEIRTAHLSNISQNCYCLR